MGTAVTTKFSTDLAKRLQRRKRYISVDVEAEVEISDISTEDLILELIERAGESRSERKEFDPDLMNTLFELIFSTDPEKDPGLIAAAMNRSIIDVMKLEYLAQVADKYPLSTIETRLPL